MLSSPTRRRLTTLLSHTAASSTDQLLAGHDAMQVQLMKEQLIRVTENDTVLGPGSKVDCHRVQPDGSLPLHRAFSVFLFDTDNRLLMQQRAAEKITFPLVWTNTCCSHPLYTPAEMEPLVGIKRAAQRKLEHELGIPAWQVPLEAFDHVATIHYKAACEDGVWGEHEVDHVLTIRANVSLNLNLNEVAGVRWFTQQELEAFRQTKTAFSPWFGLIVARGLLPSWWREMEARGRVTAPMRQSILTM